MQLAASLHTIMHSMTPAVLARWHALETDIANRRAAARQERAEILKRARSQAPAIRKRDI